MNLRRFIIRNVLRNKRRTGLTVLSIGFSLFLLIALMTFLDLLMNPPMTEQSALRLAVRRSTSLADEMPIAYMERIRKIPHVALVIPLQWFNGVYKEPKNFFANFGVDPAHTWEMFAELKVSDEAKRRFASERTAAIVGEALMKRFGWKVGDHVTLKGTIFPADLEFTIAGTYWHELDVYNFYFRYDYMNEALGSPNKVGAFWVKADRAASIPGIADAIDTMFHNSAAETKTETEKAFILGFMSMLGNVRVMIGSIALVVIFTMLLVAASTMAMTIRERLREIAILKAIGFTRPTILFLIVGEAVFIALLGFGVGVGFSVGLHFCDIYQMTQGFIGFFSPTPIVYASALGAGVGVGLLSGLFPALQASGMTVNEAMRRLE